MDAAAAMTNKYECLICLVNAFEHARDDEGRYLGKTVKLDCSCKGYYHINCLKKFWSTPVSLTSTLDTNDFPLGERTVYEDILVSGFNPETFEFVDVPVAKAKQCPVCSKSVLELTDIRYEEVLSADSSALVDAFVKTPAQDGASGDAGASDSATRGCVVAKMGRAANIHNARAMVGDLKRSNLIPAELNVNEAELLDFINNKMADVDLNGREAEKLLVDFLTAPAPTDQTKVSLADNEPLVPVQLLFRPCSHLTPAEIRDWVDASKASGWIGENVEVEIELLCSFIMYELADKDFNSRRTQKRVIDFINSQVIA